MGNPEFKDIYDWLSTVSGYCEGTMSVDGEPLVLDEFQLNMMEERGKITVWDKTRQCGFSFGVAARATALSHLHNGHTSILSSVNLADAREKIRYVKILDDSIPLRWGHKRTVDSKLEVEWSNGSRIVSMYRPRGKGPGDVYLDEFAYMLDPQEVLRGAYGTVSRGGQIFIGSTLRGTAGFAYEVLTGDTDKPQLEKFKRRYIYWWQSRALCTDVEAACRRVEAEPGKMATAAELLSTEERVEKWGSENLKLIFSMMLLEDFQQEYEIKPLESEASFISWELISGCAEMDLDQYETFEGLRDNVKGELYAGVDIGRKRNATELFIGELIGERLYQRLLLTYHNMEFEKQKAELLGALRVLPVVRMCVDETGLGMNLAEDLGREYPHIVEPVNFASRVETDIKRDEKKTTVAVKERMATDVKIAMERRNLIIYRDPELMRQIYSIKRNVSATGQVRYDSEKNEKHHADKFWALALCLLGIRSGRAPLSVPIIAIPRIRRS